MVAIVLAIDVTSEVRQCSFRWAEKEFRAKNFNYKRKFMENVAEVEEVSQLGCMDSLCSGFARG